jgi:hypothetical protein
VAAAVWWLILVHPSDGFYVTVIVVFFVELVALVVTAGAAVYRLFE